MDGRREQPNERPPGDAVDRSTAAAIGAPGIATEGIAIEGIATEGMTRRAFTAKLGFGSATAAGMVWATPRISTIRFAAKAAVGSPGPTGSTTTSSSTTSTSIGGQGGGSITVSTGTPCAGDHLHVQASGFAPKTAVALQIDSAQHPLGITTANSQGRINIVVKLPEHGPTGAHNIIATGIRPGGRTLTLSASVTIRTEEECRVHDEGTTTTTTPNGGTVSPASTTPTSTSTATTAPGGSVGPSGSGNGQGGGTLAFTGTDAIDLTIVGAAATVGGRLLYGLARPRDDEDDDD